ncbi:acyloxyacyl hydrolase [Nitrospirillum sp. BR 11828]|uniref:acyloxyacyl hydrolase n=1 Tax=Nitrospirillum sp. BR 11828 TaxID=3104325 RepID=UPI002ACAB9D8|nr:acyloxyacyl hydrolase [Nitrospirillum sp. BR 11828]MDZ5646205.1 acyloxyacyl hydrolase [Nitrospirillum sp. BR 11828]
MLRRLLKSTVLALGLVSVAAPAFAEDTPSFLSLGIGEYDVLRTGPKHNTTDYRIEYRPSTALFSSSWIRISPWVGGEFTGQGGAYGVGGILFDIPLGSSFDFTPNFGVGVYGTGSGKNLGSWVEFRSTAEISYKFENQSRLGLSFGHISNAGIGEVNPGSEIVTLYYHIPTSWLFGGW